MQVGTLSSAIIEEDDEGQAYPGIIEAGVRDERLVVFQKPYSGEPTIVYLFPYSGKGILRKHAGISVMESWVMSPIVSKVILTPDAICSYTTRGKVPDHAAKECEKVWEENFKSDVRPLSERVDEINANN